MGRGRGGGMVGKFSWRRESEMAMIGYAGSETRDLR